MNAEKSSASRATQTIEKATRSGDPFAYVGEKLARRVALAMAGVDGPCAYCRAEEAGFGDQGELCGTCAAELGVL